MAGDDLKAALARLRLRSLTKSGYFPSELPPVFTTRNFGEHSADLAGRWDEEKVSSKFWTKAERYSIPRYNLARRQVSIVNPINQLIVSKIISENWGTIIKRISRSDVSEFHPNIINDPDRRSVTGVDFDGVARRRVEILSSFGRYVKTDISRFYSSIYTHAIPWALLGKDYVKVNHKTKEFKSSFPNRLDKAIGAGQEGQTIGIPIGPDTSRIISELIAVEVETLASESIDDFSTRAVRYVDDIIIGLKENESPANVLSPLSNALYEYELEINAEKTFTFGMGHNHSPEWLNYIRSFELTGSVKTQIGQIDAFFEQALFLSDANPRDNVLLFAVKRASNFSVHADNTAHLVRWLLYSTRRSSICLSFVSEYLASTHNSDGMPREEVEAFISGQIASKADAAHTNEVAWLLFWAREVGLKLHADLLNSVKPLRSSVVALLTLDLRQRGLIAGEFRAGLWCEAASAEGLKSDLWLVAYEATRKGWWKSKKSQLFITDHEYFGDLHKLDIEFYEQGTKARKSAPPPFAASGHTAGLGGGSISYSG